MDIIEDWKKTTVNFRDFDIWEHRKLSVNCTDDADFLNVLKEYKSHEASLEEKEFLRQLLILNEKRPFDKASFVLDNEEGKERIISKFSVKVLREYGMVSIENLINELQNSHKLNEENVRSCLFTELCGIISNILSPVALFEYYVYLDAYEKEDSSQNQKEFILDIANSNEWIEYFFESYPVLLSVLNGFLVFLKTNVSSVLERFKQDWNEISRDLLKDNSLCIFEIKLFLGDPHKEWKTSAQFQFKTETDEIIDLYYKPKNLTSDVFFKSFIDFLISIGLPESLSCSSVICKGSYGWQLGVAYDSEFAGADVGEFYYFQGINTAIAYVLNIQDLISDNIIVHKNIPVFFDLEMFLLPQYREGKDYITKSNAGIFFLESVIKTGIIPSYGFETFNNEGFSNSGISQVSGQKYNVYVANNNEIELSKVKVSSSDYNLPSSNGVRIPIDKYCLDFENGLNYGLLFLMQNKSALIDFIKSKTEIVDQISSRILVRLTHVYSSLLKESYFPSYMSDHYEYMKLFEMLWRGYDHVYVPGSVIDSEIKQLCNNEVPYFSTKPSSRDLLDDKGEVIVKDFFQKSGFDFALERLSNLDEHIILQQLNIVRRALFIHNNYSPNIVYEKKSVEESGAGYTKDPTKDIGQFLLNLNHPGKNDDYFSYIDYTLTKDDLWNQGLQNCDIFQGSEGLGIYFIALFKTYNEEKYIHTADRIFNQSLEFFEQNKKWFLENPSSKIGVINFPVSTLYFITIANEILGYERYKIEEKSFQFILEYFNQKIGMDSNYSYFSGSTGALLILMRFYERSQNLDIYNLLLKAGDHLIHNSHREGNLVTWRKKLFDKWGGFAHGNSSISYALLKLADITQMNKYQDLGIGALEYDQSLLDLGKLIWHKSDEFIGDIHHSWGNGSAGIALSRLLSSKYYTNELMEREIEIARKNIDNSILDIHSNDYSIGSGSLGMLEIRKLLDEKYDGSFIINKLKENYDGVEGLKCGGAYTNPLVTGLYYGVAGIGYNLLKSTVNPTLPSLLFL